MKTLFHYVVLGVVVVFCLLLQTTLHAQSVCALQQFTAPRSALADRASTQNEYSPNLDCYWLIQPTDARVIRLTFTRFSTEIGNDIVTVYDGADTTKPVLGRFSGQTLPPSLLSSGGALLLRFRTNANAQESGWAAEYISSTTNRTIIASPTSVTFAPILFGESTQALVSIAGLDVQSDLVCTASAGFRFRTSANAVTDTLRLSAMTVQAINQGTLTEGIVSVRVEFQPTKTGRFLGELQVINGTSSLRVPVSGMAAPSVYWRSANGPFSASIVSLAIAPNNTLFAGTLTGVYRSNAAGAAWIEASNGLNANSQLEIQVLKATNRSTFAGTVNGLFSSEDGGRTWRNITRGIMTNVQSISASNDNDTIFVCADNLLFRSITYGRSWERINADLFAGRSTQAVFYDSPNLYLAMTDTNRKATVLLTSSGAAVAWREDPTFRVGNATIKSFVFQRGNAGTTIFAASAGNGLLRRDNQGAWERVAQTSDFQRDTVYQVAVSRSGIFAATYDGVFRSTDGGTTWQKAVRGLTEQTVQSIVANDVEVYAGTAAGVFRSGNGGESWQAVSTGLTGAVVTAIKEIRGFLLAGTLGSGIYRSVDNGITWSLANSGLTARSLFNFVSRAGVVFTTSFDDYEAGNRIIPGVYRSADNGTTWTQVLTDSLTTSGTSVSSLRNPFFGLISTDRALYAGAGNGHIWISQNGFNWRLSQISGANTPVAAIAEGAGNSIFAATLGNGVFRSDDNGTTWRKMVLSGDALAQVGYSLFSNDGVLFAGTFNGFFRSTNNGTTWQRLDFPAISEKPTSMQVVDGILYVATDGNGVWRTMDNGATWQEVNDGLSSGAEAQVYSIFSSNGTDLYAGLRGGAVITTSLQLPSTSPRAVLEIPDTLRARIGDTVTVPIILRSFQGNLSSPTTVRATLRFNASMLMPIGETERQQSSVVAGERLLPIQFPLSGSVGQTLTSVRLRAVLGNNIATPLMLTNIQTAPSDAIITMQASGVFNTQGLFTGAGTRLFRSERAPVIVSLSPNPALERALIQYTLFEKSSVTLSIATMLGQTLVTTKHENLPEGTYDEQYNVSMLPAGTYIFSLQTPEYRSVQTFTIIR